MNIETLLTPLSDTAPSGEDLSFSTAFDQIAELRREEDPTLDQGEWVRPLKTADWPAVQAQCADLLSTRSKDLRLAMWLAEAAALTQGYPGLQQGLQLCAQLSERFWDSLHPQADEGDMEQRVGNIGWFLGRVVTLAQVAPVTQARSGHHSLQQLQAARALQATIDRNPDKPVQLPAEAVTLERFNRALKDTPKTAVLDTLQTLQACLSALADWQRVVDAHLGVNGPSFVAAREAIEAAVHEVQRLAREVGAAPADVAAGTPEHGGAVGAGAAPQAAGGPLRSREQALAQLREVAVYFRGTEPHSPVAYLAEKAVRWGEMPLHVWLRAVVKDANALAHLEDLLGTEPSPPTGGTASV